MSKYTTSTNGRKCNICQKDIESLLPREIYYIIDGIYLCEDCFTLYTNKEAKEGVDDE